MPPFFIELNFISSHILMDEIKMAGVILMKEKNYFACANTANGFVDYFASNLQGLRKIYILKGGPGTGKSTLMKKVGKHFLDKGFDIDLIHCSSDPDSLDGVVIPALGTAIVDGTAPHVIEPKAVGAIEEYVNIGSAINTDLVQKSAEDILKLQSEITSCYKEAYDAFAKALTIHDEWEKYYIGNLDFDKANQLADETIERLTGDVKKEKNAKVVHRFFGGCTYKGPVDYIENITSSINKRYFIKGRPGSGKSTVLKKLVKQAAENGLDTEVYHCGLDSNSLDMVVLPELDLCIFDSTAPHQYFPSRKSDEIIDFYDQLITSGTDEKYEDELKGITAKYKETIDHAVSSLQRAKSLHDDLESIYIPAVNYKLIDRMYQELVNKIEAKIQA